MYKVYVLTFNSMWLGGTAVIVAKSEDEALELLEKEHGSKLTKENDDLEVKVSDTKVGVKILLQW